MNVLPKFHLKVKMQLAVISAYRKALTTRVFRKILRRLGADSSNEIAILSDSINLHFPSDHFPIFIEAEFSK